MGNSIAVFMLFAWPFLVVRLFRSFPIPKAFSIAVIGGYLLLPVEPSFNLPLLPNYNKTTATILPALLMIVLAARREAAATPGADSVSVFQAGWLPQQKLFLICFVMVFVGGILTVLTNDDTISYPLRRLPGLRPYDAGSLTLTTLVLLTPFLLARKCLARPEEQKIFLGVLAVAALLYSLPTLWEVRMSPRLNAQIYGFFPHDWRQHLRAGGYRPLVFLEHGLRLGIFLGIGILAMAIMVRVAGERRRGTAIFGVLWLLATLVLSKNLTAFVIVCLLLPAALFLRPRGQVLVAAAFAGAVLLYPMMRATNLVPLQTVTGVLSTFADPGRISSLNYRLANEDMLLEKANERPLFGWGGWARARVFDDQGRDITTTDGTWIIEFGEKGWVGYLSRFGLITLPIIALLFRRGRDAIPPATSGMAIILAANLLDLLPNSGLTPLTWVMAGSLVGFLESRVRGPAPEMPRTVEVSSPSAPGRRQSRPGQTRFPHQHTRRSRGQLETNL